MHSFQILTKYIRDDRVFVIFTAISRYLCNMFLLTPIYLYVNTRSYFGNQSVYGARSEHTHILGRNKANRIRAAAVRRRFGSRNLFQKRSVRPSTRRRRNTHTSRHRPNEEVVPSTDRMRCRRAVSCGRNNAQHALLHTFRNNGNNGTRTHIMYHKHVSTTILLV